MRLLTRASDASGISKSALIRQAVLMYVSQILKAYEHQRSLLLEDPEAERDHAILQALWRRSAESYRES